MENKLQILTILGIIIAVVLGLVVYFVTRVPSSPITAPGVTPTESIGPTLFEGELPVNPTEASVKQTESDINFQKDALDRDLRYPWIERLPISSANFFAYYDIDQQMLIIKIYGGDSQAKRDEAFQALREESIPINDLDIRWINEN